MDASLEVIWGFLRGDMDAVSFEQWLYTQAQLEQMIGAHFYLEVVSADFRNAQGVAGAARPRVIRTLRLRHAL
jgi:hypothetical protein